MTRRLVDCHAAGFADNRYVFLAVLLGTARHLTEPFELSVGASATAKEQVLEQLCPMKRSDGTFAMHKGI
jgi:hypothetical protein